MRIPRFRFRTATLLWLVVVVSAFFVGRQSDEIGRRLASIWQTITPCASPYQLVTQSDGSLLFTAILPVTRVQVDHSEVTSAVPLSATQVRITPKRDGYQRLTFGQQDGTTTELKWVIKHGKFTPARPEDEPVARIQTSWNGARGPGYRYPRSDR